MGFWNALSVLAPVAPAMAQAHDIRLQREQEQQDFAQEQALKKAQLLTQQLAQTGLRQKNQEADTIQQQLGVPLRKYTAADGSTHTVYFTKDGATKDVEDTPSGEEQYKSYLGTLKANGVTLTPEQQQAVALGFSGVKLPSLLPHVVSTPGGDFTLGTDETGRTIGIPITTAAGTPMGGQGVLSQAETDKLNALYNPDLKKAGVPGNLFTPGITRQEANSLRTSAANLISAANSDKRLGMESKRLDMMMQNSPNGPIPGDVNQTGAAYLATLPPAERTLVEGIGTGRTGIERLSYLLTRNPKLLAEVNQAYPDFDSSKVQSYITAYHDFTTGKASEQLKAGANAIQHLYQLKAINDADPVAVHNASTAAYKRYNALLNVVSGELAKFYGMPQTNENRRQLRDPINGLFNRDAAIQEQANAMGVAFNDLKNQWENAKPSRHYQAPLPGLNQTALTALKALAPEQYQQFVGTTNAGAGPAPAGSSTGRPSNASGTVDYQGHTYWVDAEGNNLGEKK